MSVILTRSPLEPIGMNHAGTQKRRSARLSQEIREDHEPPAKKSKANDASAGPTMDLSGRDSAQRDEIATMGRKRAKKVYENEIGDFAFSRGNRKSRVKDARLTPTLVTPSTSVEPTPPKATAHSPHRKQARTAPRRLPTTPDHDETAQQRDRASPPVRPPEQGPQSQASPARHTRAQLGSNAGPSPSPTNDRPLTIEKTRKQGPNGLEEEQKVMRINIPFHDTPVNRKNKKMRKSSHRRTSTSMRGRRASSLIDEGRGNGEFPHEHVLFAMREAPGAPESDVIDQSLWSPKTFIESHSLEELCNNPMEIPISPRLNPNSQSTVITSAAKRKHRANPTSFATAVPHIEVLAEEFYKHISADLLEPRRMRLLLGWCGDRALPQRPDGEAQSSNIDFRAKQAAYAIQSELCKDLMSKASLSDWYSRDESAEIPLIPLRKKPNPRNVVNAVKAGELEQELERLKHEQAEWEELQATVPIQGLRVIPPEHVPTEQLSPLNPELLESPERDLWRQFQTSTSGNEPQEIQKRLNQISDHLEFAIDQFSNGIHTLMTTKQTAARVADKTLREAATLLDERAKARGTPMDGIGALKTLGKILNSSRLARR